MSLLTIFLFLAGLYLVYMTIKMKSTGTIPKGMINSKINLERAKDIPGFINYMYIRGLIAGVVISIFGAINIWDDLIYELNPIVMFIAQFGYAGIIIYYAVISVKAQNKFLF